LPQIAAKEFPKSRTAIERLADFVTTAAKLHDDEALARSRRAVLDTIGCMLVGFDTPVGRVALATVEHWGDGSATIVGDDHMLPPPWAAFVNGTIAKAYDYDDWDEPGFTHTTAVLLPAILAVYADRSASGLDLLDAHIIGVETILRIGEAVNPNHYARGWHATSTVGALGAAAACARALGLNATQTACALSFATSMAGGFTSQFGTMMKPMHAGLAAKSGLFAASLAANGGTAHPGTLDGPQSFSSLLSDATPADVERAMNKLGDPWGILEYGLHVKLYPSCGCTHRVVEAALVLRQEHGLGAEDIEAVELDIPQPLAELLTYGVPSDTFQALFSYPYCAAAALARGRVGIDEFTPAAVEDPKIRDLARRVRVVPRPGAWERTRVFREGDPDIVTVHTRAGETFSASVDVPLGAPPRFADNTTVEQKFFDCAERAVSRERAEALRDIVLGRRSDWSVADFLALLDRDRSAPF